MFADPPAILAAFAGPAGFGLGCLVAWPHVRRMRTEVADARHLAVHDPLTGLPNRAGAQRHHRLQGAAGRAPVAVLLDRDDFKAVNDTWGHQAGDAQLCAVADRLTAGCRPTGAFAARLAGDEFLLLLPEAGPNVALRDVTAILTRLSAPLKLPVAGTTAIICTPGASAGIALPGPGTTWTELLRQADIALYQAKTRRGHAVLYTPGMHQPTPCDSHRGPRLREQNTSRREQSQVRA
jgi:diguanylate cyclase (GGDEF)-like protein